MKILLAADGSRFTRAAAVYLAEHLRRSPSHELHLLHVHPSLPYPGAVAAIGSAAVEAYHRDESRAALAVAEAPLREARIALRSIWEVGDPAQDIVAYAERHGIDLIVMGSHGHGALAALALGSVTSKVVARARVPVLIVRDPSESQKPIASSAEAATTVPASATP
jgi:nucleotide-binding universal stress UspA family protein